MSKIYLKKVPKSSTACTGLSGESCFFVGKYKTAEDKDMGLFYCNSQGSKFRCTDLSGKQIIYIQVNKEVKPCDTNQ